MNNISKEVINEIITDIYKNGLKEQYSKIVDGQEIFGYYLMPKYQDNIGYEQLASLPQLERIFINVKSKARRIYGKTNACDFENQWSEGLMYLYIAFYKVFSGQANVEKSLIVETVDDIYRIINDNRLVSKLCSWAITYCDMCFKTFMKSKGNPDYRYNSDNTYTAIDYFYLDNIDEENNNPYDEIEKEESYDLEVGDLTEYIMENYFENLTSKQKLFTQVFLWFGTNKQGHIEDENGRILFIKQEVRNYRKAIGKKLSTLMEKDPMLVENEYGRLTINWSEKNE